MDSTRALVVRVVFALATLLLQSSGASAAPSSLRFDQLSDDTVLARVLPGPKKSTSQAMRVEDAIATAQMWIKLTKTENDPRGYGYAQQALGPWWAKRESPTVVLKLKAHLLQTNHEFDAAVATYQDILQREPNDAQTRLDAAQVEGVRGNYRAAQQHCDALKRSSDSLLAALCGAQIATVTAPQAIVSKQLESLLATRSPAWSPAMRAWAYSLLGQTHERSGQWPLAQAAYEQALKADPQDSYTRLLLADLLLAQDRPQQVLFLLTGPIEKLSDAALLRLAIAAKRAQRADADSLTTFIQTRLASAAARGHSVHQREEALFALELEQSPQRAAKLALANWRVQKEIPDALLLARAVQRVPDAAATAALNQWLRETGFTHARLQSTVAR
jgi:tetratricopeptide (TPR) repeat protein